MKNTYTFDIKNTYKRQIARNYIYYGNDNVFAVIIEYIGAISIGPYNRNCEGDVKVPQYSRMDQNGGYGFDLYENTNRGQCFNHDGLEQIVV